MTAKGTLRISVTKTDIKNGLQRVCTKCPVALASARAWAKVHDDLPLEGVEAGPKGVVFHIADYRAWYTVPETVADFIYKFDGIDGYAKVDSFRATLDFLRFERKEYK